MAFGTCDAGNPGGQIGFYMDVVEDAPIPPVNPDKPSGPQAPASTATPVASSKRSEVKLARTGAALIGVLLLAAALGVGGVMLGRRKRS